MKYFFIIATVCVLTTLITFLVVSNKTKEKVGEKFFITLGGQKFETEVVQDESSMAKGLSFRDGICQYCAMLFVFDKEGDYRFWMKDMKFSIDIIWLDKDKRIIYSKENLDPNTYPNSFGPNEPKALYVLEVLSGTYKKLNLSNGQKVSF
jgi:uncharacterized membrane protein (UPF0127 family)